MYSQTEFLRSVFQQSILEHIPKPDFIGIECVNIDPLELEEKITQLPEKLKSLLFFKYVYNLPPSAGESFLSIDNAKQRLRYTEELLAYSLRLSENQRISEACMEKAVIAEFERFILEYNAVPVIHKPHYSKRFKKEFKDIRAIQNYNKPITFKRVGVALIAAIISFAMAITASAQLRVKFIDWLVKTFPLFTEFSSTDISKQIPLDFEQLKDIEINYLPDGFVLVELFEANPTLVYHYEDASGKILFINTSVPTGSPIQLNTENVQINEVNFNEIVAYWWEKDGFHYLLWQQNGFELNIIGEINYEDIIKIAENIQF